MVGSKLYALHFDSALLSKVCDNNGGPNRNRTCNLPFVPLQFSLPCIAQVCSLDSILAIANCRRLRLSSLYTFLLRGFARYCRVYTGGSPNLSAFTARLSPMRAQFCLGGESYIHLTMEPQPKIIKTIGWYGQMKIA